MRVYHVSSIACLKDIFRNFVPFATLVNEGSRHFKHSKLQRFTHTHIHTNSLGPAVSEWLLNGTSAQYRPFSAIGHTVYVKRDLATIILTKNDII